MRLSGPSPAAAPRRIRVHGGFLLEALVALVVFSLGVLGLCQGVASAVRQSAAAQWRSDAADLAAATVARMASDDPGTLATRYAQDDGAGYAGLLAAALRLPGVSSSVNAPDVAITDDGDGRRIGVDVFWQPPADPRVHRVSAVTVVPRP